MGESAECNKVIEELTAERRNSVIDWRDWRMSDWDLLRVGEHVVEVTWLDAGLYDHISREEVEEGLEPLVTKSYGLAHSVTHDYLNLQLNVPVDRNPQTDGFTMFAIPIGAIKLLRVLKPAGRPGGNADARGTREA